MRRLGVSLWISLLLLAPVALSAQVSFAVMSELSAVPGIDEHIWHDSLDRALARCESVNRVRPATSGGDALEEAGRLGYPFLVRVALSLEDDVVVCEWAILDVVSRETIVSQKDSSPQPSSQYREEFYWLKLIDELSRIHPETLHLEIKALPGTRFTVDGHRVIADENGAASLDLALPSVRRWNATLPGYLDEAGNMALFSSQATLTLHQKPLLPWTASLSLRDLRFPRLEVSRSFLEDRLILKAQFDQFLAGIQFNDATAWNTPDLISSYPLIEPALGIGAYLSPARDELRLRLALDCALRFGDTEGSGWALDAKAPVRLELSIGVDYPLSHRLSAFAEYGVSYYPAATELAWSDELYWALNGPGPAGILNPVNLRVGARFRFF